MKLLSALFLSLAFTLPLAITSTPVQASTHSANATSVCHGHHKHHRRHHHRHHKQA